MNRQPYHTPPCWWSPRLSGFWVRFWRPWRRRRGYSEHGLMGVEVRGLERLREAQMAGHGVLITPNHPTHSDPFVLLEASDRLGRPFYFMAAWQVFARTHRVGRRVLRQHGCFSINREGHDLRAIRQSIRILENGQQPLVIFPEGEVYHLNDRVTPFRRGAVTAALLACRRGGRPISVVPCGLKFFFVEDPLPRLIGATERLESALGWSSPDAMPLVKRIRRLAEGLVALKEVEYLADVCRPVSLEERISALITAILGRLEERYRVAPPCRNVPERVKQLRQRIIAAAESTQAHPRRAQSRHDLDDLFLVTQLYSYPLDYLAGSPSVERLAETLDKLEEDVFHVHRAPLRGLRQAVVAFGEPLVITPQEAAAVCSQRMTDELQLRVQQILDEVNGQQGEAAAVAVARVPRDPSAALSASAA